MIKDPESDETTMAHEVKVYFDRRHKEVIEDLTEGIENAIGSCPLWAEGLNDRVSEVRAEVQELVAASRREPEWVDSRVGALKYSTETTAKEICQEISGQVAEVQKGLEPLTGIERVQSRLDELGTLVEQVEVMLGEVNALMLHNNEDLSRKLERAERTLAWISLPWYKKVLRRPSESR